MKFNMYETNYLHLVEHETKRGILLQRGHKSKQIDLARRHDGAIEGKGNYSESIVPRKEFEDLYSLMDRSAVPVSDDLDRVHIPSIEQLTNSA